MSQIYAVDWSRESRLVEASTAFVGALKAVGLVDGAPPPFTTFIQWFERVQRCEVEATAITPAMTKLLFDLAWAASPKTIVGLGTYHGLPMAALVAGATGRDEGTAEAVGIDPDMRANGIAAMNARRLGLSAALRYLNTDGMTYLASRTSPIDLLYIDVDDPITGKSSYAPLFERARPLLSERAIVLAHDGTSPTFVREIAALRCAIERADGFGPIMTIPIDRAGLLVACRAASRHSTCTLTNATAA